MDWLPKKLIIPILIILFVIFPLSASSCDKGMFGIPIPQHAPMCMMEHIAASQNHFLEHFQQVTDAVVTPISLFKVLLASLGSLAALYVMNSLISLFSYVRYLLTHNHLRPRNAIIQALSRGIVGSRHYA